jgi:hypothetical protein
MDVRAASEAVAGMVADTVAREPPEAGHGDSLTGITERVRIPSGEMGAGKSPGLVRDNRVRKPRRQPVAGRPPRPPRRAVAAGSR